MLTPKFEIGDVCFAASAEQITDHIPCPDCNGAKVWHVNTPTGDEFDLPCGGCTRGYTTHGFVTSTKYQPIVQQLTICHIQTDTNLGLNDDRCPVRYMMNETSDGRGSGRVHNETDVFDNREEAEAMSRTIATASQQRIDDVNAKTRERIRKEEQRKPPWYTRKIAELEKKLSDVEQLKLEGSA